MGLTYHIEEDKLQAHFVPWLCPALKFSYDANNTHGDLDKIIDFNSWIGRVHLLDVELNNKQNEWVKAMKVTAAPKTGLQQLMSMNNSNIGVKDMALTVGMTSMNSSTFIAKLTTVKHDLLKAHHGCFHCRQFYVNHYLVDCPLGKNGHPSTDACKKVTITEALKAKAAYEKAESTNLAVAAVFMEDSNSSFEMVVDKATEHIPQPFSLPSHLWWDCCISMPLTCAPTLL